MSNYEREASIRPPIFDGTNFVCWKVRVIGYLQSLGTEVWDIIDIGYTFPSATPIDLAEKKKYEKNAKAVNTLLGCLSQSEFIKVMQYMLENYILRSNGTHKILQKYKHRKRTKQERHRYTWFTQFGLRPPRTASPSFSIIQQNEETQPTAKPL